MLASPAAAPADPTSSLIGRSLEEIEKHVIEKTLERAGGDQREAARILDIHYNTLARKLKQYGLGS